MAKNCGVFAARPASVREPKPMPSAPQALPYAISKRRMPDLSSRLNATRWPPASSTATESGANLASRPVLSATSRMVLACASVRDDMVAPRFCGPDDYSELLDLSPRRCERLAARGFVGAHPPLDNDT